MKPGPPRVSGQGPSLSSSPAGTSATNSYVHVLLYSPLDAPTRPFLRPLGLGRTEVLYMYRTERANENHLETNSVRTEFASALIMLQRRDENGNPKSSRLARS